MIQTKDDWDNARQMARAYCESVDVGLLHNPNYDNSRLNKIVSDKLIEALAQGLLTAYENGFNAGVEDCNPGFGN